MTLEDVYLCECVHVYACVCVYMPVFACVCVCLCMHMYMWVSHAAKSQNNRSLEGTQSGGVWPGGAVCSTMFVSPSPMNPSGAASLKGPSLEEQGRKQQCVPSRGCVGRTSLQDGGWDPGAMPEGVYH